MTPPTQTGSPQPSHPRRPPPHRSVSLRHSPQSRKSPKESDSSSDNSVPGATDGKKTNSNGSKDSSGSPSSLQPPGRDSSGESSNAEQWFQKSNNHVHGNSASFADNDPPFFMRNSSSSETPPEAQAQHSRSLLGPHDGSHSLPLRTGLLHLGTDGSSTEDFRSVIDDLTIENKTLKRRLKKYEKLHDAHLKDEKLFEVRIHGLPPHKKRELEETLRKFASSLGAAGFPTAGYEGIMPTLNTQKTASSQTQASDSAYASLSASGQGSSAQSGAESRHKPMGSTSALRKQNIHTFLHHIPEGLLPQATSTNMSERAKKKLVVRRLEQIFAGKGAVAGLHSHPIQQQEVSQSAARADGAASEAQGLLARQEGKREARIMFRDGTGAAADNTDSSEDTSNDNKRNNHSSGKNPSRSTATALPSADSEQRPTRPLDLDPHRAQVPTENIRYMRHLGFSPPNPETEEAQEGHGWVYLNLLINLAQLHTISVTSDFVRKALTEYSSKFEISNDGRKVRWKGGASVTHTSSSGGGSSIGVDTPDGQSPRKRPKLVHRESDKSTPSGVQRTGSTSRRVPDSKLVYTPLFFHKDSTDESSSSEDEDDDDSSPYPMPLGGDSSGMTSSGKQTATTKKQKKREDGPIIFYNNARFCTDLSGDRKANGNANAPPYTPATSEPVGKPFTSAENRASEKRGPLAEASELPEPMDLGDNPIPESLELNFPPNSPLSSASSECMEHVELAVTGIGGVRPFDNFAIEVESRHARVDQAQACPSVLQQQSRLLPPRFAPIFVEARKKRKAADIVEKKVIATERKDMSPSELPAALYYMPYGEDSTGDDASDLDDEMSIAPESPGAFPPATAPQPVELHYASSEYEEDDDSEAESDSSLDLLAAARALDPEAIRQQEREYDAQYAERLAEEIPAGSSAATAGGGSGFASPTEEMSLFYQRRYSPDQHPDSELHVSFAPMPFAPSPFFRCLAQIRQEP
ncbi:hypothetical protein CERZMDRAFT_111252 [Cercospora zeae-maydis SCOH1-5]|uniref:Frequency clock protein n=1 Tax=Cercospora zeae-maydis SCOH1-5 TaxID=717836 RepID=A0A6A6FJI6_9PEZI|nr:hypothetical protein CERZMDRAFT_111252 [Cercospora zeae-maydis SCOH1-5]